MENREYSVRIEKCSKELSVKEKIQMKDTTATVSLDSLITDDGIENGVTISVSAIALLHVHNEKASPNKDYNVHVILAGDGRRFSTSSESFYNAVLDIMDELADADETGDFELLVYKLPSKNFAGRSFITATLA